MQRQRLKSELAEVESSTDKGQEHSNSTLIRVFHPTNKKSSKTTLNKRTPNSERHEHNEQKTLPSRQEQEDD